MKIDKKNVVLDAVKLDEKVNKFLVVRVHENLGTQTNCRMEFGFEITDTKEVNILEEPKDDYVLLDKKGKEVGNDQDKAAIRSLDRTQVSMNLQPFKIATMRVNSLIP